MKISIITAMPAETEAVVRALKQRQKIHAGITAAQRAHFSEHELTITEAGMGFSNATETARRIIAELRPDLIVSAGLCGGIAEELRVGDAVVSTGLMIVSDNSFQDVSVTIPTVSRDFVSRQAGEGRRVFGGLFATTSAIRQKSRLATLLPPGAPYPVVDMESAAIALLAGENGIPFIGLRTVSDPFDEELGFSLDEFCDGRMRIRIPKVLLTIARKPQVIPQLIRLARNSRVAAASLSLNFERLLSVM
jgi:adenosylhomocysteine nucleosidase